MSVLEIWVNDVVSNFKTYYKDKNKVVWEIFVLLVFKKREKKVENIKNPSAPNLLIVSCKEPSSYHKI